MIILSLSAHWLLNLSISELRFSAVLSKEIMKQSSSVAASSGRLHGKTQAVFVFHVIIFLFLQLSLSYEQVPAIVENSSDAPHTKPSQSEMKQWPFRATVPRKGGPPAWGGKPTQKNTAAVRMAVALPPRTKRKLLQSASSVPYSPMNVAYNGKTCILFRAKKLAIRYKNHTFVDLTEKAFGPNAPVDTKGSVCSKDKATLSLRFGDVEDLRGLTIRLQMSNTFYESAGQNWFTLDSVHIHYNWTHEATFNATDVYAPATYSYHCQHVSSLQKYDTLLVPSSHSDSSANWHITFTDFQIQAFNVQSNKFASASDCATFFTPAILMGLITSLILLLVLAYALHMVVHLKHIDRYEEHKTTVYFPRSPEPECTDKNSL